MYPLIDPTVTQTLRDVFRLVVPEIVLVAFACVLFAVGTLRLALDLRWRGSEEPDSAEQRTKLLNQGQISGVVALVALAAAMLVQYFAPPNNPALPTVSPLVADGLAGFTKWLALFSGVLLVLTSFGEVQERYAAEYNACLLVLTAGLSLCGSANELVTLFLALELISVPTYVLLYLAKHDKLGQEASAKYFLLSVVSSAVLLLGFSYVYGVTGTTNITAILGALTSAQGGELGRPGALGPLVPVAVSLIILGLSYKLTAVPFHFYAPDVYQGAATAPVTALAFVPKAAGFVALIRLLGFGDPSQSTGGGLAFGNQAPQILWLLALFTMTIGNVMALLQTNLKRLLAYSGVAHGGYMLIGLATGPSLLPREPGREPILGGPEVVLFYLVAYGAMTVGAFAVIAYLDSEERPVDEVSDLAGLPKSHPVVAALFAVFLFSLIGLPFTAGFVGKLFLFGGALAAEGTASYALYTPLALAGVINAAIGAAYYLNVLSTMYLRNPVRAVERPRWLPGLITIWVCAILTVYLGVHSDPVLRRARAAVLPHADTPAVVAAADGR